MDPNDKVTVTFGTNPGDGMSALNAVIKFLRENTSTGSIEGQVVTTKTP